MSRASRVTDIVTDSAYSCYERKAIVGVLTTAR